MKKLTILLLCIMLITAAAGCSKDMPVPANSYSPSIMPESGSPSQSESPSIAEMQAQEPESTLTPEPEPTVDLSRDTYSYVIEDNNGYKTEFTITISSWIKGTETDILNKAWNDVGGDGSMPLTGSYSDGPYSGTLRFNKETAVYVVGTLTVRDVTEGFANSGAPSYLVYLNLQMGSSKTNRDSWTLGGIAQSRQYSSGTSSDRANGNPLARPKMTSSKWGPVPFVIGIQDVFSPKFPDGNPALDDVYFYFGSAELFQVAKTW